MRRTSPPSRADSAKRRGAGATRTGLPANPVASCSCPARTVRHRQSSPDATRATRCTRWPACRRTCRPEATASIRAASHSTPMRPRSAGRSGPTVSRTIARPLRRARAWSSMTTCARAWRHSRRRCSGSVTWSTRRPRTSDRRNSRERCATSPGATMRPSASGSATNCSPTAFRPSTRSVARPPKPRASRC